jgi:hypothetical protein
VEAVAREGSEVPTEGSEVPTEGSEAAEKAAEAAEATQRAYHSLCSQCHKHIRKRQANPDKNIHCRILVLHLDIHHSAAPDLYSCRREWIHSAGRSRNSRCPAGQEHLCCQARHHYIHCLLPSAVGWDHNMWRLLYQRSCLRTRLCQDRKEVGVAVMVMVVAVAVMVMVVAYCFTFGLKGAACLRAAVLSRRVRLSFGRVGRVKKAGASYTRHEVQRVEKC